MTTLTPEDIAVMEDSIINIQKAVRGGKIDSASYFVVMKSIAEILSCMGLESALRVRERIMERWEE